MTEPDELIRNLLLERKRRRVVALHRIVGLAFTAVPFTAGGITMMK